MIHSVRLKRFVLRKRAYHISKCLSCKQLELLKIQYLGWVLIQNYCKAHLVSWLFKERIERKRSCFSDDRLKQCARHSIRTTRAARVTRLMRWWRWVPPSKSAAWRRGAAAVVSKSAARRAWRRRRSKLRFRSMFVRVSESFSLQLQFFGECSESDSSIVFSILYMK